MDWALDNGEVVRATALLGLVLTLQAPTARPPGQPLTLCLAGEPGVRLQARAIGSRRLPNGAYEVRLRLINLERGLRVRLEEALAAE